MLKSESKDRGTSIIEVFSKHFILENFGILFSAADIAGDEFPLGSLSFSVDMEDLGVFPSSHTYPKVILFVVLHVIVFGDVFFSP